MEKEKIRAILAAVRDALETSYKIDMNTVEKITGSFLADGHSPNWYLKRRAPEEIAQHLFIMTQMLDANIEHLAEVSDDGKEIVYFVNVGQDFPGKLRVILEENRDINFVSYDSFKLRSGIRIVGIVKSNSGSMIWDEETQAKVDALFDVARERAIAKGYKHSEVFLKSLSGIYLEEEIHSTLSENPRIFRHMAVYEEIAAGNPFCFHEDLHESERPGESDRIKQIRFTLCHKNCDAQFARDILKIAKKLGMNLARSHFDIVDLIYSDERVGFLSLYFPEGADVSAFRAELEKFQCTRAPVLQEASSALVSELERIIRSISRHGLSDVEIAAICADLKALIRKNTDTSNDDEFGNFLLNALSDFFEALELLGLENNHKVIKALIGFDAFDEFWVTAKRNGSIRNVEGFRTKHNSIRGVNKGGIRNDMIVEFSEIAALAFMMTWKCARAKILFGGGKGGLKIDPFEFEDAVDFFDTLGNFGRSLFLVTGPTKDAPAGDVGCGPKEIGHMFEGFKSALRDIAMIAYGIKKSGAFMGNRIVSLESARNILKNHFDIDCQDATLMRALSNDEKYLELVCAPQITGKSRMGIRARTGATGRGLCYAILATVANEYLAGKWSATEELTPDERELLSFFAGITESVILKKNGIDIISVSQWRKLEKEIFVKLLKGKRVMVQGSGKVGGSTMAELSRFGVHITGVADRGGAIYGERLDLDELLSQAIKTGSVIGSRKGVESRIDGASGGTDIVERECDILVLAALENTLTARNAARIKTSIIACGANGPNTSKAEKILRDKSAPVIYDFLANCGGVSASYFEWLRNLTERFRYEAVKIKNEPFDIDIMDKYIMPEYRDRIKGILSKPESDETTTEWNFILRDIMISAVNEDYKAARESGLSMKTIGFVNAQLRVLAAMLMKSTEKDRDEIWSTLSSSTREKLRPFMAHPEIVSRDKNARKIQERLYADSMIEGS